MTQASGVGSSPTTSPGLEPSTQSRPMPYDVANGCRDLVAFPSQGSEEIKSPAEAG
jgi:hypothetical protein